MGRLLFVLAATFVLGFQAMAAEEGQSADALLASFDRSSGDLAGKVPDVLFCAGETLRLAESLEGDYHIGIWLSKDGNTVALIVPEGGEQEYGYFIPKAELVALRQGKISEVKADTFEGYSLSDGDHGIFGKPVSCTAMSQSESLEWGIQLAGWRVTSHDNGVTYDPPILQRKSRGHIEQYTASPAARHIRKPCKLVSRDGNVIYDPPIVRCRRGNVIEERSGAQLIPGLPF